VLFFYYLLQGAVHCVITSDTTHLMDAEAPGNAMDSSGNPEVSWWCKILTRFVACIAAVGESLNLCGCIIQTPNTFDRTRCLT